MQSNRQTAYQRNISRRSNIHFLKGLIPRFISYLQNLCIVWLARRRGAKIGEYVTMPYKLARRANSNLTIGNHSSIQTYLLDLRAPITIGNYVIIGADVEIITVSHDVDSQDWEHKYYGLVIEDYCWLATKVFILPSCQRIGNGAICAAGSVVVRNVLSMEIVSGNPAKLLRMRRLVHDNLCVESLLGNDFIAYRQARKSFMY